MYAMAAKLVIDPAAHAARTLVQIALIAPLRSKKQQRPDGLVGPSWQTEGRVNNLN